MKNKIVIFIFCFFTLNVFSCSKAHTYRSSETKNLDSLKAVRALEILYNKLTPEDSFYMTSHFVERQQLFKTDPIKKYDIVFLGNSLTERGDWQGFLGNHYLIANRGIGGDNTFGVLSRIDNVMILRPQKIFIMIGINDLGKGLHIDIIYNNYMKIINKIKAMDPSTIIYIQSILPVNPLKTDYTKGRETDIIELNGRLKKGLLKLTGVNFIDLFKKVTDSYGVLKADYTNDGVHLTNEGYNQWIDVIQDYISIPKKSNTLK